MTDRVPFYIKLNFGIGQMAEGLKNISFSVFLLFYYNQVLGLEGWLAGLALALALVFDAVTDPLAGSLSDNWHSRLGRRHPFMYASAVPLGIAFFALFCPPAALGQTGLFLWLVVMAVATRAAMTLYHVPHIALGAELSEVFEERTVIVAFRQFFGYVGALTGIVLGFGVFFVGTEEFPRGQLNVDAYAPYAATVAVVMVITILLSAWGTQSRVAMLPMAGKDGGPAFNVTRIFAEYAGALRNRNFAWLVSGVIIVFVMVGVDAALNLYMNTYFWELSALGNSLFLMAALIGAISGAPLTSILHARFDKLFGVLFGTSMWLVCQISPILLRFVDLLPQNGTFELEATLVAVKFLQGLCVVQALISFNSMMADLVDENELRTGLRQEGVFFGAVSFANKSTTGLGTFIGGLALTLIDWPLGAEVTAAQIPAATIFRLGLVYGPLLIIFGAVAVWCYAHYDLSRERHHEIREELTSRRRQAREAAAEQAAALDGAVPD